MLVKAWASATAEQPREFLMNPDVSVTNGRDKIVQIAKLEKLTEALQELLTDAEKPKPKAQPTLRSSGTKLIEHMRAVKLAQLETAPSPAPAAGAPFSWLGSQNLQPF